MSDLSKPRKFCKREYWNIVVNSTLYICMPDMDELRKLAHFSANVLTIVKGRIVVKVKNFPVINTHQN